MTVGIVYVSNVLGSPQQGRALRAHILLSLPRCLYGGDYFQDVVSTGLLKQARSEQDLGEPGSHRCGHLRQHSLAGKEKAAVQPPLSFASC
jgi:hypothetical protein